MNAIDKDKKSFFEDFTIEEKMKNCPMNPTTGTGFEVKNYVLSHQRHQETKQALVVYQLENETPFADDSHPEIKFNVMELCKKLTELGRRMLRILAIILGQDPDFFLNFHEHLLECDKNLGSSIRLTFYPPMIDGIVAFIPNQIK